MVCTVPGGSWEIGGKGEDLWEKWWCWLVTAIVLKVTRFKLLLLRHYGAIMQILFNEVGGGNATSGYRYPVRLAV